MMKMQMKKYWLKSGWFSALLLCNAVVFGGVALAEAAHPARHVALASEPANVDAHTNDGDLSVIRCIEKGGIDFGLFLDGLLYNDGFMEGVIQPWNDILGRNQCHSSDVYNLIKQQDKMRMMIRDAFLTCNTQNLPQLKKAYHRITAEIYYVRHVVDSGLVLTLPVPAAETSLFQNSMEIDSNTLKSEMVEKYVKEDIFSQADFDQLFTKLESKYKDRKKEYKNCTKSSWEAVGTKWKEFIKFFSEDAAGLKDAGKTIGAQAVGKGKGEGPSLLGELKGMKTVQLFTTDESFKDYLKSYVQLNVNNLTPQDSLQEADEFINKHLGGSGLSQSEYLAVTTNSQRTYSLDQDTSKIKAHFDGLYRKAADENLELFINSLDGRQTGGPDDGLLEIVNNTFVPLNDMLSLSKKILNRQCVESE